ncbi:hypothetical protein ACFOW6_01840 [Fodinicurvata halophila]|uniref:Uncharacterized protein n=1 Tax=Fodinicurvata halophila TaxID=1419723 RepID=A0ABV8UHF1_9PROT
MQTALEGGVLTAHRFPVVGDLAHRIDVEPGVPPVKASASTMVPSGAWLVLPDSASMAQSTASTPVSAEDSHPYRNYLEGPLGTWVNALLSAIGYNFHLSSGG